jgi:hypothetical protein
VRIPGGQTVGHLARRGVPPDRPPAVIPRQGASGPLLRGDLFQVGLGREAEVRLAPLQQRAHITQVDHRTVRLGVRTVPAVLAVLVRADPEVGECLGELAGRALGDTRLVGVLDADQVPAAGLARDVHVNGRHIHPPDVQVTGRARAEPGDLRSVRKRPRRVTPLPVLWARQAGREQGADHCLH